MLPHTFSSTTRTGLPNSSISTTWIASILITSGTPCSPWNRYEIVTDPVCIHHHTPSDSIGLPWLVIPAERKQLDGLEPCLKRMTNGWMPRRPSTETRS
ncbi:hypothetical protein PAXRUDRAFT_319925 [Paxillus rubicundulus Ve08.2h10]|uniref:Uncharacterized protein n=1 Tax=Paxillus rubicundulus Ve08.2h10 TaxID=930991 RepID=A0A0D0DZV2_9AGAM|nr:hypothetical protein PAXRUDRAFT_319925 [Paxillus rubicundulus Ve08.2h10]